MLPVSPLKPRAFNLAEFSKQTLLDRYMIQGETEAEQTFARCALAFADDQEHAERLHGYFAKKWLGPATPPLSNAPVRLTWGKDFEDNFKAEHFVNVKGPMPISCFLNGPEDSRKSLAEHYTECVWLGSNGGGVGAGWGNIREANAPTSNGQKSGGMIPFVGVMDRMSLAVAQGSNRRFAYAAYLPDNHPEIEEFIALRNIGGDDNRRSRNIHIGVLVSDALMHAALVNGDWDLISPSTGTVKKTIKARSLIEAIATTAAEKRGEPFVIFIDEANRKLQPAQKALGLRVHTSNLCVAPETKILTDKGHVEIANVVNQQVNVWNGTEYSAVTVRQTGTAVSLLTIDTDSGFSLDCTPEHRFYVQNGYSKKSVVVKQAKELVVGDKLIKLNTPVIQGDMEFTEAYSNGFYSGDGCAVPCGESEKGRIYLYGGKRKLTSLFKDKKKHIIQVQLDLEYFYLDALKPKFTVPSTLHTVESRLNWLAGYLDSNGTVCRVGTSQTLQIGSVNPEYLRQVQLMLQSLGVQSKITLAREAGLFPMPANDSSGDSKEYPCQRLERLLISGTAIQNLLALGLKTHRLVISNHKPQREATRFVKVAGVVDKGRVDDTYCFTEPKKHLGVFNGLLTGQCTEIVEATSEDRTAVCCLSSVNIDTVDEWKDNPIFIEDCIRFLDNILQYFIENAPEGMEKAVFSATMERSIGLGSMGWHSYMQRKGIPYQSAVALGVSARFSEMIKTKAVKASRQLAKERGEPQDMTGTGLRNAHLITIAPTATNSIICNSVSPGGDIFFQNQFSHRTLSGLFQVRNAHLEALLESKGLNLPVIWKRIGEDSGSVQWMTEYLTDKEREVYLTAREIDMAWHIEHHAMRQPYVCQAQSLNLTYRGDVSKPKMLSDFYLIWRKGLKSRYYVRTEAITRAQGITEGVKRAEIITADCVACEG